MNTVFYYHESEAAKQRAAELGIPYSGRSRLNILHFRNDPGSDYTTMMTIEKIKQESDYFQGYCVMQLEGKGE